MLSSVVAAFALSIYACAPEDENPATNRPRGTLDSGVDPTMLSAAGYGQYQPLVPNDTPEHKSQNRRIEIVLAPSLAGR